MKNFIDNYILFPKGVEPTPKMYSSYHLICFILALFLILTLSYFILRKDLESQKKSLNKLAIAMLSLEAFRILWWLLNRYADDNNIFENILLAIRFDWCNQVCIIMPIVILWKKEKLYDIIVPMAFIGGSGVLFYPASVFDDYQYLHMMPIQSYISHALMVYIAFLIVHTKLIKPDVKHFYRLLVGFALAVSIAFITAYSLPENRANYMNIKMSIIPLLKDIPHPYYLIFQFIFMFEAICLVYFAVIYICRKRAKEKLTLQEKNWIIYNFVCIVLSLSGFFLVLAII